MEKDLKFATLKSSKETSIKIEKLICAAYNKNTKIYGRAPSKKFHIIICHSDKEWKKESKYYYFPFGAGTVLRDGTFVVKEHKFFNGSDEDYKILLDHEMNHVFFALFYGVTKPTWVHEGLANFVGGYPLSKNETFKEIKTKLINHKILQYRYLYRNYPNRETVILNYSIWKYFIEFISDNNPGVIISFMNEYIKKPTHANYNKLFVKYFQENPKRKFQNYIKWLNK